MNWDRLRVKAERALNTIKVVKEKGETRLKYSKKKNSSIICRSKMDYGCQIYSTVSSGRTKKLDSKHRKSIRTKPTGVHLKKTTKKIYVKTEIEENYLT